MFTDIILWQLISNRYLHIFRGKLTQKSLTSNLPLSKIVHCSVVVKFASLYCILLLLTMFWINVHIHIVHLLINKHSHDSPLPHCFDDTQMLPKRTYTDVRPYCNLTILISSQKVVTYMTALWSLQIRSEQLNNSCKIPFSSGLCMSRRCIIVPYRNNKIFMNSKAFIVLFKHYIINGIIMITAIITISTNICRHNK